MKSLAPTVPVVDVPNEGLISLLGQKVTVFCSNYIYDGILEGVNDSFIKLTSASLVFETGSFNEKKRKLSEAFPNPQYIMLHAIESVTVLPS
jgi:hypothetical protein